MRRVGWKLAAVYEMTGLDFTDDLTDAQRLHRVALYWCPKPSRRHRQGWSVLYDRWGNLLGVWPARPSKAVPVYGVGAWS